MTELPDIVVERATAVMPRLGAVFFKARAAMPPVLKASLDGRTLAPRHVQALNIIALAGRLTVGELASQLRIGLPAGSQIASELEAWSWLARERDETDQRRIWLTVAADRRDDVERYCRRRVEPLLNILGRMDPREQLVFLNGLEQLAPEIESFERTAKDER